MIISVEPQYDFSLKYSDIIGRFFGIKKICAMDDIANRHKRHRN